MTAKFKNIALATPIALLLTFVSISPALAASPDGLGPWADSVLSSSQGLRKDGSAIPASRSDVNSVLGVAENNTTEGNFYSLGFGGNISLGFDNGISSGVIIVEATNNPYPNETANVEVSENGTTWVSAGSVTQDGSVNKPESVGCARYVRIIDTSIKDNFPDTTADGYDVDGVKASGEPCTPPAPTPTPGGGGKGVCSIDVKQTNITVIENTVISNISTGGNKSNKNTGGSTNITTGNASTNMTVTNSGGSNIANLPSCGSGDINSTISGNGAGSTNTINVNTSAKEKNMGKNKLRK